MLLHPVNKIPIFNQTSKLYASYEHGNMRIKRNSVLSIVFVFCVVSTYNMYDIRTNRIIPPPIKVTKKN